MKWYYKYLLFLLLWAGLSGCENEPAREVELNLNLCLPANESAQYAPRRVMGDPGANEVFALPKYAYIFIMKQEGALWSVWRKDELILEEEKWERTDYKGILVEQGDGIYKYKERIRFLLNNDTPKGRVYIICSNKRLTLSPLMKDISTLSDVVNLKFNTAPDSIQKNLQNIYSTPYNYSVSGSYYCTYDCSLGNTFQLDLLMYHIASKVDLQWYVDPDKRIKADPAEAVRLTYMEARRLFNGYAYCFKPLRNEVATLPTTGYDIPNIVTPADEGLWWEGRSYFYTIPYTVTGEPGYFPLQMLLGTNGTKESAGYELTLKQPIDTTKVFVPWLRGTFNLTEPLATTSETKIGA